MRGFWLALLGVGIFLLIVNWHFHGPFCWQVFVNLLTIVFSFVGLMREDY